MVEDRDRRVVVANDRFKECFGIPLFVDLVVSTYIISEMIININQIGLGLFGWPFRSKRSLRGRRECGQTGGRNITKPRGRVRRRGFDVQ